jgi:DNA repair exonuclease SbcCD ATPase subunit
MRQLDFKIAELRQTLEELKGAAKKLENVDVDDAKVEKKLKDLVKGNLPAYVKALDIFMKKINVPEDFKSETLKRFVDEIEDNLKHFNKRTFRNYHIIQNLVGDELAEVVMLIKKIDSIKNDMNRNILGNKLQSLEKLQNDLKLLYDYLYNREKEQKRFEDLISKKQMLIDKEKELSRLAEQLKKSEEFKQLNGLKVKLDNLVQEQNAIKRVIEGDISVISRALRKLNKVSNYKLLENYVHEPYETLLEDDRLEIAEAVDKLKDLLQKNQIVVKNKEKVMSVISALSRDALKHYKDKLEIITAEVDSLRKQIENSAFKQKEIELKQELEIVMADIAAVDEKISSFKQKDLNSEIEQIKQDLKRLGLNVKLKNVPLD